MNGGVEWCMARVSQNIACLMTANVSMELSVGAGQEGSIYMCVGWIGGAKSRLEK